MAGPEFRPPIDGLRVEAETRYTEMGFDAIFVSDEPGKVYAPHAHHEVFLFGLSGTSRIRVGNEQIEMTRGIEVHIGDGEEHEATVGEDGAEYLFAHPGDIDPFSYEP